MRLFGGFETCASAKFPDKVRGLVTVASNLRSDP